MENKQPEEAGHAHGCLRCYRWVLPRATAREEIPLQEMAPPAEQAAQQEVAPVAAENPQPRIAPQQPINQAEAANMENGQPEEAGHAHGCLRCYRWVLPRATPWEEIPLQEMAPPAEQAAQQEVAPVAAENPQPRIAPQQPINQAEAANMENPRQPEEAESDHEECCCACFYPPSIPREEIPLFPLGQEPAQQAVVPVAAVNLQPMSGPQQPLNQAVEGIGEADMELECTECPKENYTFYIVFSFTLLFLLFLGQALNILSYELGWRGNGTENASMQTNSNATTESNMIFDITTAITI